MQHFLQLFGPAFAVLFLSSGILGYLGLHVLKREVIFVDIALAQFAALGAVVAHFCFSAEEDSLLAFLFSLCIVLVMAIFYSIARRYLKQISLEAVIGISYAVAAAGALFVIGNSTAGHTHVQQMLCGSILWTEWGDVVYCTVVFGSMGLCFQVFRKAFERISDHYDDAVEAGMLVIAWDFLFYFLCGVVIVVAVGIAGIMLTFTMLIIPATVSALFSTDWTTRFGIAWLCGILASVLGLMFSHYMDFSAGTSVALFLAMLLLLSALYLKRKSYRKRKWVAS